MPRAATGFNILIRQPYCQRQKMTGLLIWEEFVIKIGEGVNMSIQLMYTHPAHALE